MWISMKNKTNILFNKVENTAMWVPHSVGESFNVDKE